MGRWRACFLFFISAALLISSAAEDAWRAAKVSLRHTSNVKDEQQAGRALQGVVATDPSCNVNNAKYTAPVGQIVANAGFPQQTFAGLYGFGECSTACKNDSPCHSFSWNSASGACLFFQQSDNPTLTTSAQGWKSGAVSCSSAVSDSQVVAAVTSAPSVAIVPPSAVPSPAQPQTQSSVPSPQGSSLAPTPSVAESSAEVTDETTAAKSTSESPSPPAETQQGNALALLAYPYWLWLIWAVMAAIIVGVCIYTMRQVDREGKKKRKSRKQAKDDEESESTQDAQISPTEGYELLNPGKQEPPIQLATTLNSGVPLPPATLIQPQAAFIPGTHR